MSSQIERRLEEWTQGVEAAMTAGNLTGVALKLHLLAHRALEGPYVEFRTNDAREADDARWETVHDMLFGDDYEQHGTRAPSGPLFSKIETRRAEIAPVFMYISRSTRLIFDDEIWKTLQLLNKKDVWVRDNSRASKPPEPSFGASLGWHGERLMVYFMTEMRKATGYPPEEIVRDLGQTDWARSFVNEHDAFAIASIGSIDERFVALGKAYRVDIQLLPSGKCFKVYAAGDEQHVNTYGSLGKVLIQVEGEQNKLLRVQLYKNRDDDDSRGGSGSGSGGSGSGSGGSGSGSGGGGVGGRGGSGGGATGAAAAAAAVNTLAHLATRFMRK